MTTERKGKGTIFLRKEFCKGCAFCIETCPTHCLEFGEDFNEKGYHYPVLARPEKCTGCDICGMFCPDFAIFGITWKKMDKLQAQKQEGGKVESRP